MQARGARGFTLIELMIVVVVIGILAAIAIPKFNGVSKAAKEAEAEPILKQVLTLQERHHQKYDAFANDFDDLEGAADPVRTAKYFEFRVQGNATGFTVCATPRAGFDLRAFQIDETRAIAEIAPAACAGNT